MSDLEYEKISPIWVQLLLCVPLCPVLLLLYSPMLIPIVALAYPFALIGAAIAAFMFNKLTAWPKPAKIARGILLTLNAAMLGAYIWNIVLWFTIVRS